MPISNNCPPPFILKQIILIMIKLRNLKLIITLTCQIRIYNNLLTMAHPINKSKFKISNSTYMPLLIIIMI